MDDEKYPGLDPEEAKAMRPWDGCSVFMAMIMVVALAGAIWGLIG